LDPTRSDSSKRIRAAKGVVKSSAPVPTLDDGWMQTIPKEIPRLSNDFCAFLYEMKILPPKAGAWSAEEMGTLKATV
jgi:hypothetical protein